MILGLTELAKRYVLQGVVSDPAWLLMTPLGIGLVFSVRARMLMFV